MTQTLSGKIALVTGGSRNIGKETALALAAKGARVIVTYRAQKEAAAATVAEIEALGVQAAALQVDLNGTHELDSFLNTLNSVLSDWGRSQIDILVNNAGALRIGTFDRITEDDLDTMYNTNFKSVVFLTQKLADQIADGGRIINLGSGTARIAFGPLISYGPLKAALQSMTLYWASFFGKRGITVNAVAPGGLDDDFNAQLFNDIMPGARDYIKSQTAVDRVGLPNDVSGVIAFLAEPAASFVSGTIVNVDGGYHL